MGAIVTRGPQTADSTTLVGITTRYGAAMWVLFVAIECTFALASLRESSAPALSTLGLGVLVVVSVLLVRPHPDPFPLSWTALLLLGIAASAALNLVGMPAQGWPGFTAWHIGAATWMLFVLALRGRVLAAWLGYLVLVGLTTLWSLVVGRPLGDLVGLHSREAGLLLVGTVFAVALRRVSGRITALTTIAFETAAQASALEAEQRTRRSRVDELSRIAVPLLREIAAGVEPDDERRVDYRVVEARLRDAIRARSLAVPSVIEAADAARRRGVEVVLLDDRGVSFTEERELAGVLAAITSALEAAREGIVTVRLGPAGREVVASIVAQSGSLVTRHTVSSG